MDFPKQSHRTTDETFTWEEVKAIMDKEIMRRAEYVTAVIQSMRERFGEEALEVAAEAIYQIGYKKGKARSELVIDHGQDNDLESLSEFVAHKMARIYLGTTAEVEGNQMRVSETYCPLPVFWRSIGMSDDEVVRFCKIFDQVDYQGYHDYIAEEVRSWSYMKFPFIKSIGNENGWYRVGPLSRVNTADFIDTPLAEEARKEFMAVTDGKPNNLSLAYHWTRMIELLHSGEKIKELLNDSDLQGEDLVGNQIDLTVSRVRCNRDHDQGIFFQEIGDPLQYAGEDGNLHFCKAVLQTNEGHLIAAPRIDPPELLDPPADGGAFAALELGGGGQGDAIQLQELPVLIQRVCGDVEPEQLSFECQQIGPFELGLVDHRVDDDLLEVAEDRYLPGLAFPPANLHHLNALGQVLEQPPP